MPKSRTSRQRARELALIVLKERGCTYPGSPSWEWVMGSLVRLNLARPGETRGAWFQRYLKIWKQQGRQQPLVEKRARAKEAARVVLPPDFLSSWEWTTLRYRILLKCGRRCMCCGRTPEDGVKIHVDHIKPRATHPELALEESNLQVLCGECNKGKGAWDRTDWRPK